MIVFFVHFSFSANNNFTRVQIEFKEIVLVFLIGISLLDILHRTVLDISVILTEWT